MARGNHGNREIENKIAAAACSTTPSSGRDRKQIVPSDMHAGGRPPPSLQPDPLLGSMPVWWVFDDDAEERAQNQRRLFEHGMGVVSSTHAVSEYSYSYCLITPRRCGIWPVLSPLLSVKCLTPLSPRQAAQHAIAPFPRSRRSPSLASRGRPSLDSDTNESRTKPFRSALSSNPGDNSTLTLPCPACPAPPRQASHVEGRAGAGEMKWDVG